MWKDEDHPYVEDDELWNKAKADYALEEKLDLVYDDSPRYGKYFKTPYCMVLSERNKKYIVDVDKSE